MSDLPVSAASGQPYGVRGEQEAAQRAVPMGSQPVPAPPPALMGPSANPGEPVQAGLPSGPGAGPETLAMPEDGPMTEATLKRLYQKFPSRELRMMMTRHSQGL